MTEKEILELIDTGISADEHAVRKAAFHAILDGKAIDRAGLVTTTGFAPEKVEVLLDGLIERGLVVIEPDGDRVVGSWGLSLAPSDHRLRIRERELYTWCAVDAVGIPAGLDEDGSIVSRCHQCGAAVHIEMRAGQVAHAAPPDVRLWVTAGDVGRSVVGFT